MYSLGTFHSNWTVVVLLHKHFSSWHGSFFHLVSIITDCMYTTVIRSNVTTYANSSFIFFKLTYCVQFLFTSDCLWPVFHSDCTRWCRLMFLAQFGSKIQCCWRGNYVRCMTMSPACSIHTHVTDCMKMTFSANLHHRTSGASSHWSHNCFKPKIVTYRPRQITLNRKLFEQWRRFYFHVKVISRKEKWYKTWPACIWKNLPCHSIL